MEGPCKQVLGKVHVASGKGHWCHLAEAGAGVLSKIAGHRWEYASEPGARHLGGFGGKWGLQ